MYKRIKNLLANRLATGASILTITTFLSYLTGLLRDRIFSRTFGAGHELDLYNTSFIVPDLLLNILVSSALSAAFIPIFTDLSARGAREKANELANTVLHGAILVIFLAAVVAAIFMPWLSAKIAPGFSDGERQTLISLSRLMLISPLIIALSSGLGAMLVSFKKFLPYGLSPIFYNFGIIGGALTAPWLGVYGLVLGTLVGALLHLLPRLVSMRYTTYRYARQWRFKDAHFLKVIKLMIPKMIG
ncbi:MAG: lipid II flippase MurJ, partial [Patescibacteria group bacterium]